MFYINDYGYSVCLLYAGRKCGEMCMEHQYFAECRHIRLLPLDEFASEEYRQLRNKEENRKWFFHDDYISETQQRDWFRRYMQKEDDYMFAVQESAGKHLIGGIAIYDINRNAATAEIGRIIIDRDYSGRGYGTEAICGIVQIAREKFGLKEVYACIRPENMASRRSFEKSGFLLCVDDVSDTVVKMKYYL